MPESAAITTGPSLEQILWRAMDRFENQPALVDADEFAHHIEEAFEGDVPAEAWVARFFEGDARLHGQPPADMAEAIVRASKKRLHVYEFDLNHLEYVIVEDDEKVVVVSDFGQFALQNDDFVSRAIESAVIPKANLERGEPRAYFVRKSGDVAAVDANKVARSLRQFMLKQVSMPAVDKPGSRLLPFAPQRKRLTEVRETQALRQDARTLKALPPPPRLERARKTDGQPAAPTVAQTAIFVVMPDGTLARPEIGSATRWAEMLGTHARAAASAAPVTQRVFLQTGKVVAVVDGATPSSAGERAMARGQTLSAVRSGMTLPVKVLGDDELAKAISGGAKVVPGFAAGDRFWIQPEAAFKPDTTKLPQPKTVATPIQLGEITGDPWADWALTGGGDITLETLVRGGKGRVRTAGLDQPEGELSIPPELAERVRGAARDLKLTGAPVIGFRSPDGTVVLQSPRTAVRLAALGRPDAAVPSFDLQLPGGDGPLAARSGAIPATALAALQMALQQTANASGFQLPMMHIVSEPDALDVGGAMSLASGDSRRTTVRLMGRPSLFDGGPGSQVARLVLSMPFPNQTELHVGSDLTDALQAYLGGTVQPASRGAFAPAIAGGALGSSRLLLRIPGLEPGDDLPLDWSGMHLDAFRKAQDAVITLDLPSVQPLVAGSPTLSGLPVLLQRALVESGDWTPGPGAPMPVSIRELAMRGPFDGVMAPDLVAYQPSARPLNPGEEEIVIPMPLWAQMGRGMLSETDRIMASPLAPAGYTPPMGVYRLVVPMGGPVDLTGGAPYGTPGIVELTGPTGVEIALNRERGAVFATTLGGRHSIARVALDDGESAVTRRGRIRIGAPISSMSGLGDALLPIPELDAPSGTIAGSRGIDAGTGLPARPSIGPDGEPISWPASGDSNGFAARALAAGQRQAAGSMPSLPGGGSLPNVPMSVADFEAALSSGGGDQTLVATASEGASSGVQTGSAFADMTSASSSAAQASSSAESSSFSSATVPFVTGLRPGMWSGHRRLDTPGYQTWSYRANREDRPQTVGGVDLASLSRPVYPSLPTSLRFRYVGAPLWWSSSTTSGGLGRFADQMEDDSSPASRAMRAGVRAANSAATIWRSILVASPQWGGANADLTGGMDSGHDANADEMSSLSRKFDSLTAASLVAGAGIAGPAAGGSADYIALGGSGAAGTVSRAQIAKARADAIEMRIVAAIPPAPPPLESMGSSGTGDVPHARAKAHGHGGKGGKEHEDAVSHSKIEGSVDAIAQRIYHRIRRRIQSDRERFGG